MFEVGDGLNFVYTSPPHASHRAASNHTCLEVMCYTLAIGPRKVILCPSTWTGGDRAIAQARQLARQLKAAHQALLCTQFLVSMVEGWAKASSSHREWAK